jgi:hypothetical protein
MGLNWFNPEAALGGGPTEAVGGAIRKPLLGVAKAVSKIPEEFAKAGTRPSRPRQEDPWVKKRRLKTEATYEDLKEGTVGAKIETPVSRTADQAHAPNRPISKTRDREEYNKFHKELRNYAHRLKNNKDASADMKKRLDRIKSRGKNITERELEDELQVMKVVGRVTGASKKSAAWKSFVSKDQWWFDKAFGTGIYPAGKRSRVTAAKVFKKDVDKWVTGMSRLVKTLEDMGL